MIKIVKIRQTCVICPTQYEGKTDDDRPVYIRYRWGYLSVRVGDKGTSLSDFNYFYHSSTPFVVLILILFSFLSSSL
jgi:hypothetical protein